MFSEIVGRMARHPNSWAAELSTYILVAVTLLGAGNVETGEGQLRIRFLRDLLPPGAARVVDGFANAVNLLAAAGLTYIGYLLARQAIDLGSQSVSALHISLAPVYALLPVGGVLLFLQYAAQLVAPAPPAAPGSLEIDAPER